MCSQLYRILVHNQNYGNYYLIPSITNRGPKQWKNNFLASILDNNIFYVDNFFLLRFHLSKFYKTTLKRFLIIVILSSGILASYSFIKQNNGKPFCQASFR